jgi:hypothetical protein
VKETTMPNTIRHADGSVEITVTVERDDAWLDAFLDRVESALGLPQDAGLVVFSLEE